MKKVFWQDPYQTELTTHVMTVQGNEVTFFETIAFSFSGGQESDRATVQGLPVLGSRIVDKLIYYTLPEGHGLMPGDTVSMQIDWLRRYRLMRLHFAAELILELVTQTLGAEKIGAHIAEDKARIDFNMDESIAKHFDTLLERYDEIIKDDRPIEKDFSDEAAERRYWQIAGFAKVPCGGTHVRTTAEVGHVTLKRKNIGGGKERIEIRLA